MHVISGCCVSSFRKLKHSLLVLFVYRSDSKGVFIPLSLCVSSKIALAVWPLSYVSLNELPLIATKLKHIYGYALMRVPAGSGELSFGECCLPVSPHSDPGDPPFPLSIVEGATNWRPT